MLDNGTLAALHRRAVGHRADVEPDDLRQGDRGGRLRRRDPREGQAGLSSEELFFELAIEDLHRAADLFHADPRAHATASTAGCSLEVSPQLADDTATTVAGREDLHAPRRPRQPVHQDPGHRGGPAGDRGDDRRRHACERDAPLSKGAVPGRRGRVHEGDRAARRRTAWIRPSARSPRCSSAAGTSSVSDERPRRAAATTSASRSASTCTRRTASCSTPIAGCGSRTRARGCSGCCGRARARRTRTPRHALRQGLAAPFTDQHDARQDTLEAFADHGEAGDPLPADGGDATTLFERVRGGRASTSTRWPRSSSPRAATSFVKSWKEMMQAIESEERSGWRDGDRHCVTDWPGRRSSSTTPRSRGAPPPRPVRRAMRAAASG